jgi:hypothetical protein
VKPVNTLSWTVGPPAADDGAAPVDDDPAGVVPELLALPVGVPAVLGELELHPESATAPTTSAAIVVTSGFMRWTSMPRTRSGRLLRPPEGG